MMTGTFKTSYDKQHAIGYIVYMITSSYFGGGSARGFDRLYLHYAEMPRQKQYEAEEQVILAMDRLASDFLEAISQMHYCATYFTHGSELILEFNTGGFESLRCTVQQDGSFFLTPVQAG